MASTDSPDSVFTSEGESTGQRERQSQMMYRKDSIQVTAGREGQFLQSGMAHGKAIGVFTSGGDSPGERNIRLNLCFYFVAIFTPPYCGTHARPLIADALVLWCGRYMQSKNGKIWFRSAL